MMDKKLEIEHVEHLKCKENKLPDWTPKHRKNCLVTFQKDGVETKMHIMNYLRYIAQQLPPMQKNGRRVVHFDELRWLHLHGKTKEESQKAINDYCENIMSVYRKAIEDMKELDIKE